MGNGKEHKRRGLPSPIHPGKNLCETCHCVETCIVRQMIEQKGLDSMGFITAKQYAAGEKIYVQGEPLGALHLLCSGLVFGSLLSRNADESLVYLARGGSFLDLLDQEEQRRLHTCSVETLTPSVVAFFDYRRLREITMEDAPFAWGMFGMAMKRLRQLSVRYANLSFGDAKVKVVYFLLELAKASGNWESFHVTIPLKLRRQILAIAAGITVETVSRVMGDLHQAGYIQETSDSLEIHDVRPLKKIVHG